MTGQMWRQMRLDANWPHARATAPVRDTKRLMQVEMADITAQITGARQTDHCVHIGTVDIDLTAIVMGDLTNLMNCFLKHTMGRGIGDHAARQVIGM